MLLQSRPAKKSGRNPCPIADKQAVCMAASKMKERISALRIFGPGSMVLGEDNESRWIVCRPRGGINDTLCQIEKCWQFAKRTGRTLIIDSEASGLLLHFDDIFEFRYEDSRVRYQSLAQTVVDVINLLPAWPLDTEGRVTTYESIKDEADEFFTLPSYSPLKYDLSRDHQAPVLVYEAMGGGIASFCFLSRVILRDGFRHEIKNVLTSLPEKYASIHVRQSDLSTDYESLFFSVKKKTGNLPVFVASDNSAVIDCAREIFGKNRIISLPPQQARDGKPLHSPTKILTREQRESLTAETLTELFALAGASDFFYGDVTNRVGVSGFSRLAGFLTENPETRRHLLGDNLTIRPYEQGKVHHVTTLTQRIYEKLRWRRHAQCR